MKEHGHSCKACAVLPPEVRELAQEQLEMRFPSRQEPEDFEDDSELFLDEDDDI